MEKIKTDKKTLRKFGITMAIAFMAIAALLLIIKHRNIFPKAAIISAIFLFPALIAPRILKPIYIIWMKLAFVLSWVNTRLILCTIFYLVFTPVSIFLKLLRKDLLDRKIDRQRQSYWIKKGRLVFKKIDYERQY